MGYDDSNNVFMKNLGIFNYILYTVHKIDFEGRYLYKIRHAGPLCGTLLPLSFYKNFVLPGLGSFMDESQPRYNHIILYLNGHFRAKNNHLV